MKKTSLIVALAGILVAALAMPAVAADKAKEVTITGEGKCAKCSLKEKDADKCQTVIQAQEDGKTVNYYLADNKVAKDFHENICKDTQKVKAIGKVKEENGKKVLTVSKIEVIKDPAAK